VMKLPKMSAIPFTQGFYIVSLMSVKNNFKIKTSTENVICLKLVLFIFVETFGNYYRLEIANNTFFKILFKMNRNHCLKVPYNL